jgi:hypothetical protein
MGRNTKENSQEISDTDLECSHGVMGESSVDNGKMANNMEKGSIAS